ncbi:GATA transcription factor 12 [Perilla frutescens var. hirtella]|nr:GATA transcription factor 12 [Perilla frutescens var. hirtella]
MESASEFFQPGYYDDEFPPEKRLSDAKNGDHFIIDDLLDLPNDDTIEAVDGCLEAAMTGTSADSSPVTAADAPCNSSFSIVNTVEPHFPPADICGARSSACGNFSGELCVPYDDLAELEWLSNFVEESFSNDDLQKLQLIQGIKARTDDVSATNQYQIQPETTASGPMLRSEMSVPAKARSKRSRAAPGNWTSRLLVVSPPTPAPAMSSSSESDVSASKKVVKPAAQKKRDGHDGSTGSEGRRCLHCATDKTPQWRTGPMGPKTLCNACGVRYKSGRLVPEYRPASSPTFVLTKHSNSHRKVLELRRQKEQQKAPQQAPPLPYLHHHHHHQNVMFDVSNGDDYLIHQHIGPDYRQLI